MLIDEIISEQEVNLMEAKKPVSEYEQVQTELRDALERVKFLRARLRELEPKEVKSRPKRVAQKSVIEPFEEDPFLAGIRNRGKMDWPLR